MNQDTRIAAALERIGLVLGALYTAQLGKAESKPERLNRCGFSASEIAGLLGMTTNAVNVALHRVRKSTRRASSKAKKK